MADVTIVKARKELAVREGFRLFLLEAFKQFLGRYVRAFLPPPKNISPNRFKGIFSCSPMPGFARGIAMGGPHLAGPPQLGQLRQELIEALPSGPLWRTVAGYQSRLALANAMQQFHGVELRIKTQMAMTFHEFWGRSARGLCARPGGPELARADRTPPWHEAA